MTREEIWERLKTEVTLRGYSPLTINTYKAGISTFLDWCDKPYEDLDEEDFRNYLIHIIEEGRIKPGTINSYNGAIRFFLVVILGKNINYMRTARLRGISKLPYVWSPEEVERFFSVIDNPRDLAIFVNIYGSGALRRYWKIFKPSSPDHYLFPGRWNKGHLTAGWVEHMFNIYKEKAGITASGTVHTLRHCFATHALEAGTDVLYIKQLLGHSCFSSTDTYLHIAKTSVYRTPSPADSLNQ